MFDEHQKPPGMSTIPKMMAISAIGLILSLGLCGIGAVGRHNNDFGFFTMLGFGLFLLSLLGVAVSILAFIVQAVTDFFRK